MLLPSATTIVPILLVTLIVSQCRAYAVMSSTEGINFVDAIYEATAADLHHAKDDHITRMVQPSEIQLPTLEQIKLYVDTSIESDELASNERHHEAERQAEEEEAKVLSYKEIYKLLALWQLEKEKNAYSMQPEGGNRI